MTAKDLEPKNLTPIPRPDISVGHIVLLILTRSGPSTFSKIIAHPLCRTLGEQRSENSFYTALARLKRRRMVIRRPDRRYELTLLGQYAALKAYVRKEVSENEKRETRNEKPQITTWDGKWRLALFDVPEAKRPLRDYLRTLLKRLGFYEFQRSMWISPHRPPKALTDFLADHQIRRYTRLITSYDIDYDEDLRRYFRLL